MWDLPRPGLEPVSLALAGRFSTTAPPGKPHHIFLIHSSAHKYFGCFYLLAVMNNAAMKMSMQISPWNPAFNFLGYTSRNGIAGSYGSSIFNFLRKFYTVFHSSYTILHCHQQYTKVPISPHPCQHLLLSGFFDSGHPNGCEMISHCGSSLPSIKRKIITKQTIPSSSIKYSIKFFAYSPQTQFSFWH